MFVGHKNDLPIQLHFAFPQECIFRSTLSETANLISSFPFSSLSSCLIFLPFSTLVCSFHSPEKKNSSNLLHDFFQKEPRRSHNSAHILEIPIRVYPVSKENFIALNPWNLVNQIMASRLDPCRQTSSKEDVNLDEYVEWNMQSCD